MGTPNWWHSHGRYPYLLAKGIGVALIAAVMVVLVYRLRLVVIPVVFAGAIAFVLHPAADWLVRRRVPRGVAAALMVFVAVLAAAAGVLLIVPTLFTQLADLASRIPAMLAALDRLVSPILEERFGVTLRMDPAAIASAIEAHASELAAPSGWLIEHLFQSVVSIALAAVNTVIVIVLTYYIVESHDAIGEKALAVIPPRWRDNALAVARAVDHALSAFILGQVTVCVLMAALYAIALSLIGVEGGAIIGILTGLANFVPYLGLATGLSLSLLSVGLNYTGPGQIAAVLAVFGALPLLDSTLITPKVVGNRTGLNPFVVIVALLVGADLAGPLGLLLALPTAAVLRALLRLWLESYRKSRFFLGDGAEPPPGPESAPAAPAAADREPPPTA